MDNVDFAKSLIKGRIAETIFAQMLRGTKEFTVLEFGYEKIIPELVQQGYIENRDTINILRTAPDFAVINRKTKTVRLIEVKYERTISPKFVLGHAKKMSQSWNPSYLFVATLDGFYFDEISEIIKNNGDISPLRHPQISDEIQGKYIEILRDFERNN
ncbi:MAG: hypothetical protein PHX30_00470 [Candidatus Pacebacteria bacterium]|nr:hypothetical protein [Candidatus Paceibacterota bacterium]